MATRFFRLLDPQFRQAAAVFRIRESTRELRVERWSPADEAWTPGPGTLLRFVNEGELGADEIPEEEARRLIASGDLPPLPAPIPAS